MADKKWGRLGGSSGRMHKFAGAGTQTPGVSSQEGHSTGRRDQKAKAGPSNVPGFSTNPKNQVSHAGTQTPGQTAAKPTNNDKWAKGGSTHMHGNTGSRPAIGGRTSQ